LVTSYSLRFRFSVLSYKHNLSRPLCGGSLYGKSIMLNTEKVLTIFLIVLSGLLVNPLSVFGQCPIKIVEKTDSSFVVEAKSFKGLAFTKNWLLGEMYDINNKKWVVTTKNFLELPKTAQVVRPTLQEICDFETTVQDWWNQKSNRSSIQGPGEWEKEAINQFNRQYLAYVDSTKIYIQVTLFPSSDFDEEEWKTVPIACDHCWPSIFMLNYDIETQQINLNTNFK